MCLMYSVWQEVWCVHRSMTVSQRQLMVKRSWTFCKNMAALRTIQCWLPVLHRSCTAICPRLRPTTQGFLQVRPVVLSARRTRNSDKASNGRYTVSTEEEDDEDFIDDSEVEELFQQQENAGLGQGQQRLFIVHPDVKWGSRKQHLTTGETCVHSRSVQKSQYVTVQNT